jgi:hypothetical protein
MAMTHRARAHYCLQRVYAFTTDKSKFPFSNRDFIHGTAFSASLKPLK